VRKARVSVRSETVSRIGSNRNGIESLFIHSVTLNSRSTEGGWKTVGRSIRESGRESTDQVALREG